MLVDMHQRSLRRLCIDLPGRIPSSKSSPVWTIFSISNIEDPWLDIGVPGFDMMHLSNLTELTFLVSPPGMKHLAREDRETLVTFLRLSLMQWN